MGCIAAIVAVMLLAVFALTLFLLISFRVSWPTSLALSVLVSVTVNLVLLWPRKGSHW